MDMYSFFKRLFDIIFSMILMPIILILVVFVGMAIKVEDKGPIFYMSERIGRNGKIFEMFKFRSMKVDSPDIRLNDGSTYNANNDPRVTKIGNFIRKTSIDEIPQAINILVGHMSFIGPRPDSAMWLNHYTDDERVILNVRPGISGYNQVVNRNNASTKDKIQNDIYYVQHMSFIFDVRLVFLTIKNVLLSKNVYRINNIISDNGGTGKEKEVGSTAINK